MPQTHSKYASNESSMNKRRLNQLRLSLKAQNLDAFLVPKVDEHQGEYVPPSAERLQWLTGFTGSAGFAIILRHQTALFVDGRYTLQAHKQVNTEIIEVCPIKDMTPQTWLKNHLLPGQRIGFDPWLHTKEGLQRFRDAMGDTIVEWVPCLQNPIDILWTDRPVPPQTSLKIHDTQFAGQSTQDKLSLIISDIKQQGAEACIITLPPSIAWLFNIRSHDIPYLPAPLAFAFVHVNGKADLFLNPPT